jgi:hypothetical protein
MIFWIIFKKIKAVEQEEKKRRIKLRKRKVRKIF